MIRYTPIVNKSIVVVIIYGVHDLELYNIDTNNMVIDSKANNVIFLLILFVYLGNMFKIMLLMDKISVKTNIMERVQKV